MIDEPFVVARATLADRTRVAFDHTYSARATTFQEALERFVDAQSLPPIEVNVVDELPEHAGLGSRTATMLAILKSACLLADKQLDDLTLQRASGRGGTSGIGIHGFFTGGWIFDAGQPAGTPLFPSSAQTPRDPSLLVKTVEPPEWPVGIFLTDAGSRLSGQAEIDFFRKNTPTPRDAVLEALSLLYHSILPALLTRDLEVFSAGVMRFQEIGFKGAELENQSSTVRELISSLRRVSPCAGMSSVGPAVFAIGETSAGWDEIAAEFGCAHWCTRVSGNGWKAEM